MLADGFTVDRHGFMLLGGFNFADGDRNQFIVAYIPLAIAAAPRLKLGITGSMQYQREIIPDDDDLVLWAYHVLPMAQYDWRLPIESRYGDFAIAAEGGVGYGQIWIKFPSALAMTPGWQHITAWGLHTDAAFQFLGHSGLVVSVQPFGLDIPLHTSDPPSSDWTLTTKVVYSFALAAGYRWR